MLAIIYLLIYIYLPVINIVYTCLYEMKIVFAQGFYKYRFSQLQES